MAKYEHPPGDGADLTVGDLWHRAAAADDALCREFARRCDARLPRTLRSQRVGWLRQGRPGYGLLLPDYLPAAQLNDGDWYIFYAWGETLFRRSCAERDWMEMLVLAESADDWAELLRQALRERAAGVSYRVAPQYMDALGEVQAAPSGWEFTLEACPPPHAVCIAPVQIRGAGDTPEAAARDACREWLRQEALAGRRTVEGDVQ